MKATSSGKPATNSPRSLPTPPPTALHGPWQEEAAVKARHPLRITSKKGHVEEALRIWSVG
jgi:hypothetical protein